MQSSVQGQISVEFAKLSQFADFLPEEQRQAYLDVLEKTTNSTRRLASTALLTREALSQLRFDANYLIFDVEATRRERDRLQRQLDELTR